MNKSKLKRFAFSTILSSSLCVVTLVACSKTTESEEVDVTDNQNTEVEENIVVAREVKVEPEAKFDFLLSKVQNGRVAASAAKGFNGGTQPQMYYAPPADRSEKYTGSTPNPIKVASSEPVSTFSIDVDTGAYSNMRRMVQDGYLPNPDALRSEEFLNYFNYNYTAPTNQDTPFSTQVDVAKAPWSDEKYVMRIGLKGYEFEPTERPAANVVFLLDVSGSMGSPDKLPLVKRSLKLLSKSLKAEDTISIVVYAGASGVVLEPTKGNDSYKIIEALDKLDAGGSTAGGAGIQRAYALAESQFIEGGVNRVVLATDGDFNVGIQDKDALTQLIEDKRKGGVSLTTLGFGTGNYREDFLEKMANVGDGNYAYIDSFMEAKKVLSNEFGSTMMTIAKDVKIQVEFNPAVVAEYRLIGYENRLLNREDFNNDKIDAGEIGAGHSVTALYELTPTWANARMVDDLRYGDAAEQPADNMSDEFGYLRLRYKAPNGDKSKLIETPMLTKNLKMAKEAEGDMAFAIAVASFAERLRDNPNINVGFAEIKQMAELPAKNRGDYYSLQFLELLDAASTLKR